MLIKHPGDNTICSNFTVMKQFDFYGQMILIILGLLLAIDYKGWGLPFAGLVMFVLGVWQLISTLVNLFAKDQSHLSFFRINLLIAVGYTVGAVILILVTDEFHGKIGDRLFIAMMAIPPFLIFRYWIGISKIYNVGFFKKR